MIFEPKDGRNPLDEVFIPLHAKEVSIGKRRVATGRVKVSVVTHSREEPVSSFLRIAG
jgi:ribosomal protein L21